MFSILMKIPVFPLPQSRTPALVFEHVNNTDFKVGAKRFLRLLSSWCGNLLSWHTRCLPVLECVCDGGIWTVQCYVFGARKSAIFWFYPQSLAHSLTVYGSNLVLSVTVGMFINLFFGFFCSNFTRHWQTTTSDSTCTRFLRSVFFMIQLRKICVSEKNVVFFFISFVLRSNVCVPVSAVNSVCFVMQAASSNLFVCKFFGTGLFTLTNR